MSDEAGPDGPPQSEPGAEPEPRGPDLARAALDAARQAARRRAAAQPAGRRRVAGSGDRRRRGGYSGAGPDSRDPQPFGVLVRGLLADRGWERTAAAAGVTARWPELVGAQIAGHSRPVSLHDGELVVEADSTAWATQLRLLAPRLVARLNAELGQRGNGGRQGSLVRVIRVNGPVAPSWRRGPLRVVGPGPRDTYG
ncbi:MAG TPA: DciA family protein [Mycobacteriales bacterium]|nr:DciA family protein [Mycobacteriales bacterium]